VGLRSVNEQAMGQSQDVTKGRRIVAALQCTRLAAKAGYNNSRDNTLEVRLEQSCGQRPKGGGPRTVFQCLALSPVTGAALRLVALYDGGRTFENQHLERI
jgi:hypothetical protein